MTQELRNRVMYGLLAAGTVLFTILFLGSTGTLVVALIAALLGWREYSRMMNIKSRSLYFLTGFPFILIMFLHSYFVKDTSLVWLWGAWVTGFVLLYLDHRTRKKTSPNVELDALEEWTVLCRYLLGLVYIYLIFGYVPLVAAKAIIGTQLLIVGLSVVFLGDTGAYFAGRRWGKRKLWPEISPNKTVEGAIGGICSSIVAAIVVWSIFKILGTHASYRPLDLNTCLMVAIFGGPLAQASDLLESLIKRAVNRKDSGGLIPGHGGILDRADGLAFFMPFLYYFF